MGTAYQIQARAHLDLLLTAENVSDVATDRFIVEFVALPVLRLSVLQSSGTLSRVHQSSQQRSNIQMFTQNALFRPS